MGDIDMDDMDPLEVARLKKQEKKAEEQRAEMEKLMEDIETRRIEREKEEERDKQLQAARLQRIKDRESREQKRAEEEGVRLKKKEEEWARKRAFEEERKREREDKILALKEQDMKHEEAASSGPSALEIAKQNMEAAAAKKQLTEEEKEAKKEDAVRRRVQEYDERFDRMRENDLREKATELHEHISKIEGEKYDLQMIFKKQEYDIRELLTRINEIQRRRRKTIHLGGSRRMQQDEQEKAFLGVKGMVDKFSNINAEKNKMSEKKKALEIPKRQKTEEQDEEEAPPEEPPAETPAEAPAEGVYDDEEEE